MDKIGNQIGNQIEMSERKEAVKKLKILEIKNFKLKQIIHMIDLKIDKAQQNRGSVNLKTNEEN